MYRNMACAFMCISVHIVEFTDLQLSLAVQVCLPIYVFALTCGNRRRKDGNETMKLLLKGKTNQEHILGCYCHFHQHLPEKRKYFVFADSRPVLSTCIITNLKHCSRWQQEIDNIKSRFPSTLCSIRLFGIIQKMESKEK